MNKNTQEAFEGYEKPPDQIWTIPDDEEKGVYRFILAASRRARQLQLGARPSITTRSRKPTKIAMEEVRSQAVTVEIVPEGEPWPPPVAPAVQGLDPFAAEMAGMQMQAGPEAYSEDEAFGPMENRLDDLLGSGDGGEEVALAEDLDETEPAADEPEKGSE